MKWLLSQFKVVEEDCKSVVLEILFDFAVVAMASLIFSGFIINNMSAPLDQKYFMITNAGLLSVHWFVHIFFKQRYAKRNSFYRIWVFVKIVAILMMAIGIDLMAFRKNQGPESQEFLRWSSMIIFLAGFIILRFFVMFEFMMGVIVNKRNKAVVELGIYKSISRGLTTALAIAHIILVAIYKTDIIPITTYIFMPLYLVIEFLGNIINVNDKNLSLAPKVSLEHAKERYVKLNLLYIASFFVAGTIQFAYYFRTSRDLNMLGSLFVGYLIGFLIWWSFIDRVYRFQLKDDARSLKLFTLINIIESIGIILMGAMIINSHQMDDHDFMIPTIFFGFALLIVSYFLTNFTLVKGKSESETNNIASKQFLMQNVFTFAVLIIFAVITIYIKIPMYAAYIITIGILISMNITSRITIGQKIKK